MKVFMKVFKILSDLDDKIVGVVNDAYLWFYDWTGVYVASVILVVMAPEFTYMMAHRLIVAACFFGAVLMFLVMMMYYSQATSNAGFNKQAESMQRSPIRTFFLFFCMSSLAVDVVSHNLPSAVCNVCNLVYWFVICVKIRDRNKKTFELFAPKVQHVPNA